MSSSGPFLASSHGHPNFNPTKTNISTKSYQFELSRNPKQPKPPEKPLMPYMRYSKRVWDDVRAMYPESKVWEVSKIVGQMWRDLDENEKQRYVDEFEIEKIEYNELLKQYHNSPAYQQWIASLKMKENDERDGHKRKEKKNNIHHPHNSPQKSEGRYTIQSMDGDENEEYFSTKQLAAARYYRNNKLVHDIFDETIIPDIQHDPELKVQMLRRQIDSLVKYQKKLDEELKQIEENFQQKKHAIIESSEKFQNEMNKRFAPNDLDTAVKDHYKQTLIKTMEMMKKEQQQQHPQNNIIHNYPQQTTGHPLTNNQTAQVDPSRTSIVNGGEYFHQHQPNLANNIQNHHQGYQQINNHQQPNNQNNGLSS